MDALLNKVRSCDFDITFKSLKEFIETINIDDLDYESGVPQPEVAGDYGRNIYTCEPFEVVLIHWPAGVESAVHHHKGLFGYVWVIEGELDNVLYKEKDGKLIEFRIDPYGRNGLMPEPEGVIHKIRNNTGERALSIHFYYPALEKMGGLRIFDCKNGREGILSDQALTASWSDKPGHFLEVRENAFQFVSNEEYLKSKATAQS